MEGKRIHGVDHSVRIATPRKEKLKILLTDDHNIGSVRSVEEVRNATKEAVGVVCCGPGRLDKVQFRCDADEKKKRTQSRCAGPAVTRRTQSPFSFNDAEK